MVVYTKSGVTINCCGNLLIASDGKTYKPMRENVDLRRQNYQQQLSIERRSAGYGRGTVRRSKVLGGTTMQMVMTNSGVELRVENSIIYTTDSKAFWRSGNMLVGNGTVISYQCRSMDEAVDMVAALYNGKKPEVAQV